MLFEMKKKEYCPSVHTHTNPIKRLEIIQHKRNENNQDMHIF